MRRPMVIANWKMYTDASDALILATTVRNNVASISNVEIVLCPPVIWLSDILSVVGKSGRVKLGAQNMFYEPEGAYTGEISPIMIKDVAKYVIVGHSERREHFGETELDVNEKVIAALKAGLYPIVCVGEKKRTKSYPGSVVRQLEEALSHVPKKYYKNIIVVYEPVWAISSEADSKNADPDYVAKIVTSLREIVLRDSPILYGGSVNSKNAGEYATRPEIDGILVGAASLRASEFVKICRIWSEGKDFRTRKG